MINYVRLTYETTEGIKRMWARRLSSTTFLKVKRDGSMPTKGNIEINHFVIGSGKDIIKIEPASISKKYGWLEKDN